MVVDLAPQRSRATLMLVAGVGLVAFSAWGVTRPDLFEGRVLPIMAFVAGAFFVLVAVALRRVPHGLDALELDEGRLTMHERGETVSVGLAALSSIVVVDEPLGRGHPLLCLGTRGGGLVEVALMREGHIEPMSRALREDIALGVDELPSRPENLPVALRGDTLEAGERSFELADIAAVDFVHHLSVHGPGLVIHNEPPEPLDPENEMHAAAVMRRIAAGEHVPLPGIPQATAVALALHIDRARTMMQA
jgi:hypothetical protein